MILRAIVRRSMEGAGFGVGIGAILCVFPLVAAAATMSTEIVMRGGSRVVPLVDILITMLLGGGATGFLAGFLSPLARPIVGAALVGAIAGVPTTYMGMRALDPSITTGDAIIHGAIVSIMLGAPLGLIYRHIFLEDEAG